MSGSLLVRRLVIVSVFGGLAYSAYYFLHIQQSQVGLPKAFAHLCPAPSLGLGVGAGAGAYYPYTGKHEVDFVACLLVNFFHTLLTPPYREANVPLILAFAGVWFTVLVDAASVFASSQFLAIGVPALLGVFVQLKGAGLGLPIYWLVSLLLKSRRRAQGRAPAQPNSRAILAASVATLIGAVVPTVAMVVKPTHGLILLWQPFPLYCSAVQILTLLFTPTRSGIKQQKPDRTVYYTTQLGYALCALIVTFGHLPFLRSVLASSSPRLVLRSAMSPYPHAYSYPSLADLLQHGATNEIVRFIQWDILFIGASTWLAGAWSWAFVDIPTFLAALIGSIVVGFVAGPGFQLAGVYMVQTWKDEQKRVAGAKAKGTKKVQ